MRNAGSYSKFLTDENCEAYGIYLSGSGCAEQERGVRFIQEKLGINPHNRNGDPKIGMPRYSMVKSWRRPATQHDAFYYDDDLFSCFGITRNVDHLYTRTESQGVVGKYDRGMIRLYKLPQAISGGPDISIQHEMDDYKVFVDSVGMPQIKHIDEMDEYLASEPNKAIKGLWDEEEFVAIGFGSTGKSSIQALTNAYLKSDLSVWYGNGDGVRMGGLNICVTSKIPQIVCQNFQEEHLNVELLKKAKRATGIEDLLKKAGRGYYALEVDWADDTRSSLKFWLNPYDQEQNKSGWFTLDDLKDWANGNGIIIKEDQTPSM